jgi:hypothetical protein
MPTGSRPSALGPSALLLSQRTWPGPPCVVQCPCRCSLFAPAQGQTKLNKLPLRQIDTLEALEVGCRPAVGLAEVVSCILHAPQQSWAWPPTLSASCVCTGASKGAGGKPLPNHRAAARLLHQHSIHPLHAGSGLPGPARWACTRATPAQILQPWPHPAAVGLDHTSAACWRVTLCVCVPCTPPTPSCRRCSAHRAAPSAVLQGVGVHHPQARHHTHRRRARAGDSPHGKQLGWRLSGQI